MSISIALKQLKHNDAPSAVAIELPSSKSISNRLLILKQLYFNDLNIHQLSEANDTLLMQRALEQLKKNETIEVEDAGTVARFITAASIFSANENLINCSNRMLDRPMQELVDVLEKLGASFTYLNKSHHLPFKIKCDLDLFKDKSPIILEISTAKSSQFLSAIIMIAPKLDRKIVLELKGEKNSYSYVKMTIQLMLDLGFKISEAENNITIEPYIPVINKKEIEVERDWSAAAFIVEILANQPINTTFLLNDLYPMNNSAQGDAILGSWASDFGIEYSFNSNQSIFRKKSTLAEAPVRSFKHYPDLALAYIMAMVLQKKKFQIRDVETLQYKESNRMEAIAIELAKCNVTFEQLENGFTINAKQLNVKANTIFNSHNDHRIAMCLAPLAWYAPITILQPQVVNKSFPKYWDAMRKLNFEIINT